MHTGDELLEYYRRELAYLRTQSADFAARYPKVARHLRLSGAEGTDPHTEHLIESVAFLTARVHRDLERDLPAVASAMLDTLCPNLTRPVPAMTVMQLTLDPKEGKVTAGMPVRRGTLLSATAVTGEQCRFQVGWNATLWPLRVDRVVQEEPRTLRLDFVTDGGIDVAELELDTLRLHLAGDLLTTMPLHELLVSALVGVELVTEGGLHRLGAGAIAEAGFAEDEALLAQPGHGHPAYGLLQEYFAFPRKFQFFDLRGLRGRLGCGAGFSIRLVFTHGAPVLALLGPANLLVNCVPAVNLFPVTSEPIAYDRRRYEYLLVPDRRRDAVLEVHTVQGVTAADPRSERTVAVPHALAGTAGAAHALAWTMRRETSLRPGIVGTDVYLAFLDGADVRAPAVEPVLYADLLCTNRQLADHIAPGTRFYGDGIAASTAIRALYQPSAQRAPAVATQALWALVALMRLNHQSLVDGGAGVQTLQRLLLLFAGAGARDQVQVRGIARLSATSALARLGADTWRGHCRGTDVTLEFDTDAFAGTSPLVLAAVLARFFALYTTANSFVRLAVTRRGEPWKQWPALAGRQCLI